MKITHPLQHYTHKPKKYDRGPVDIGDLINRTASTGCVVEIPPGLHHLGTPIDCRKFNQICIKGTGGHRGTTLIIPANQKMIGIDCRGSREVVLENLRIMEEVGARSSACVALGGVTLRISNCWFSNTKYGIFGSEGAGISLHNILIEACDWGIHLQSYAVDPKIGIEKAANIHSVVGSQIQIYNCTTGFAIKKGLKNLTKDMDFEQVSITKCKTSVINEGTNTEIKTVFQAMPIIVDD